MITNQINLIEKIHENGIENLKFIVEQQQKAGESFLKFTEGYLKRQRSFLKDIDPLKF